MKRREFLKRLGRTAAVVAAAPVALGSLPPMTDYRMGVDPAASWLDESGVIYLSGTTSFLFKPKGSEEWKFMGRVVDSNQRLISPASGGATPDTHL